MGQGWSLEDYFWWVVTICLFGFVAWLMTSWPVVELVK